MTPSTPSDPIHPSLGEFHPIIADWFGTRNGTPTPVQSAAWPIIMQGDHLLAAAPTGSGKTLAAFLWPIHQLAVSAWPTKQTSVLYVSPLKALNHDIRKNLLHPLTQIAASFRDKGLPFPDISVMTRSGDTLPKERRQLLKSPPEILITTPESLAILLNSASGRSALSTIRCVILDEIHAVIATRRGTLLMASVERLANLQARAGHTGEFQRIALSATIRPPDNAARFVAGYRPDPATPGDTIPRPVRIISPPMTKRIEIRVECPVPRGVALRTDSIWEGITAFIRERLLVNRSTLVFTRSRRLCERLTRMINEGEPEPVVYSHHGSLARTLRHSVETRLKAGELRGIVATNSLELGIDIGSIDEIIFVQTPSSVSSAIQKLGRSGHAVGETSRGVILPTHPKDYLEAAVLASEIEKRDIESVGTLRNPLDVLPQILISMVAERPAKPDELFDAVRCSDSYHTLPRKHFDTVIEMLTGRYRGSRIRELSPRIDWDRTHETLHARPGAILQINTSGGVIPDRGYFAMRLAGERAQIGELDEEFVWEARPGQVFSLGTQSWKIERITHNDVQVVPAPGRSGNAPFWKAEESCRDFHFSEAILRYLGDPPPDSAARQAGETSEVRVSDAVHEAITRHLTLQKAHTRSDLPHRHHIVLEFTQSGPNRTPGTQLIIHTLWGGRLNRPFSIAFGAALEDRFGYAPEIFMNDDSIAVMLPVETDPDELMRLVTPSNLDALIAKHLERTGFFGARFRECAGRAMLLGRTRLTRRMPLWMSRLRAKRLMGAVLGYTDFPMIIEAWRTCMEDEFDMPALRMLLDEIHSGAIRWTAVSTPLPSPFAEGLAWRQINFFMYEDDRPEGAPKSRVERSLVRDLIDAPDLKPTVTPADIERFEGKLRRLEQGYTPEDSDELIAWIEDAAVIRRDEWERLIDAIVPDHAIDPGELRRELDRIETFRFAPGAPEVLASSWIAERIRGAVGRVETNPEEFAGWVRNILAYRGPVRFDELAELFGMDRGRVIERITDDRVLAGRLVAGSDDEWVCDLRNYEMLTRAAKRSKTPTAVGSRTLRRLNAVVAGRQGILTPARDFGQFTESLDRLIGMPMPATAVESDILPARCRRYDPAWLDRAFQESGIYWQMLPGDRVVFLPVAEPLIRVAVDLPDARRDALNRLFPDTLAGYDATTLYRRHGGSIDAFLSEMADLIRSGAVTATSFDPVRNPLDSDANRERQGTGKSSTIARSMRHRTRQLRIGGLFRRTPDGGEALDEIDREELRRNRVRLLLDRYGVLQRELLRRELPEMQWPTVFKAIRLMELAGELQSGLFFEGLGGLQFMRSGEVERPEESGDKPYWISTLDPAWCGAEDDETGVGGVRRTGGTHVVMAGETMRLVSVQNGRHLTLFVPWDDPGMAACFDLLRHLITRQAGGGFRIVVDTINGEGAPGHPFWKSLPSEFDCSSGTRNVMLTLKLR